MGYLSKLKVKRRTTFRFDSLGVEKNRYIYIVEKKTNLYFL